MVRPVIGHQSFLLLPRCVVNQIILKAAEAHAIPTEDVACFQSIAQQTIDQELIAVWQQAFSSRRVLGDEVAFEIGSG